MSVIEIDRNCCIQQPNSNKLSISAETQRKGVVTHAQSSRKLKSQSALATGKLNEVKTKRQKNRCFYLSYCKAPKFDSLNNKNLQKFQFF